MKRSNRRRRVALAALLALIVSAASYAFTATNTFAPGIVNRAGDGTGAISGFVIQEVHYSLDAADPSKMDGARIVLDQPANEVAIQVVGSATWATCTSTSGTYPNDTHDCAFSPSEDVAPAASLRVVAVS